MKNKAFALICLIVLSACSQNDKPQNTGAADYAETEKLLIQNKTNDTVKVDSLIKPTAMPAQQIPTEQQK